MAVVPPPSHEGLASHRALWTDVTCQQLIQNQKVVTVDANMSTEAAAEVLVRNGISSAPVCHEEVSPSGEKKMIYSGMFDYRDLVSYLLVVFNKKKWAESEEDIEIKEIIRRAMQFQPVEVKLVSDLSHNNPFYSVTPETSLLQAMDVFSKGIHRVAVMDPNDNTIHGILTQSNVANFLLSKINSIPTANKTLKELGLGVSSGRKVVAVPSQSNVFAALQLMAEHGLSSVPLVDGGHRLVGSLSMSDIKYVLRGYKYNMLWQTCFYFLSFVRNKQGLEDGGRDRYPMFDVRESETLAKAMGKICATRAHRVWIVDEQNKLSGVVSLTDVLKALLPSE